MGIRLIEQMNYYTDSLKRMNVVWYIVPQVNLISIEFNYVYYYVGVSRSATIVLAYLMKYHHNTLREAFFYLVEKRPQIWPNEGFLLQLIRYETELIRSREISIVNNGKTKIEEENPIETINEFETKHKNE